MLNQFVLHILVQVLDCEDTAIGRQFDSVSPNFHSLRLSLALLGSLCVHLSPHHLGDRPHINLFYLLLVGLKKGERVLQSRNVLQFGHTEVAVFT
jgi:hypothetical protein